MSQKLKSKISTNIPKEHELTEYEWAFIQELSLLLTYHTEREKILGNYITYIAKMRLGYETVPEGFVLKFDINVVKDKPILTVQLIKEK